MCIALLGVPRSRACTKRVRSMCMVTYVNAQRLYCIYSYTGFDMRKANRPMWYIQAYYTG